MLSELKGILLTAAIAVAIYSSSFLVIFTPLPFLYEWITWGRRRGILALLIAAVAIATMYIFFTPELAVKAQSGANVVMLPIIGLSALFSANVTAVLGIGYFMFFAVVSVTLGEGVLRKWSLVKLGSVALLSGIAVLGGTALTAKGFGVEGFSGELKNYIGGMVLEMAKLNQSSQGSLADASLLKDYAGEISAFMVGILPSMVFVYALVAVVLNLIIGRRFIRGRHAFSYLHNIANFKLPDGFVWAVIASGALFFADNYYLKTGWLEMVAVNGLIALGGLYFFQGLSVVVYFLQGFRARFLKTLAYLAIIMFFQTVGVMIVAIGVADVWANFRFRHWRAKHAGRT